MQHKYYFEAVHRTLTDICSDDHSLFGGVPTLFSGDFAQILPVIPRGKRADIVNANLQKSFLWPSLRVLSLRLNMRVRIDDRTFRDRAIPTVRNDTVTEINNYILNRVTGTVTDFYSVDTVEANTTNSDSSQEPPPAELLQIFNPPSLLPSKLRVKVGAPVILLRNLYLKDGLYNGTRMVVTHLGRRCIERPVSLAGPSTAIADYSPY